MKGKLIDAKVPKGYGGRRMKRRLFGVFVATVVSKLYNQLMHDVKQERSQTTQTSYPLSTSCNGRQRSASVRHTHTSLFMRIPREL